MRWDQVEAHQLRLPLARVREPATYGVGFTVCAQAVPPPRGNASAWPPSLPALERRKVMDSGAPVAR